MSARSAVWPCSIVFNIRLLSYIDLCADRELLRHIHFMIFSQRIGKSEGRQGMISEK